MSILDKLRIIAKAKFSDKTKLGQWYESRIALCSECPFNSENKEHLTVKELAMVAVNLGKGTCLGCGCEYKAKASVRSENCGLVKLGMKPVWEALPEIYSYDISNLIIENLSSEKIKINLGPVTELIYGNIKQGSDTEISLSLASKVSKLSNIKLAVSCGCTSAVSKEIDGKFFITLKYDSSRLGEFTKTVSITFTEKDTARSVLVRLKGVVNKY